VSSHPHRRDYRGTRRDDDPALVLSLASFGSGLIDMPAVATMYHLGFDLSTTHEDHTVLCPSSVWTPLRIHLVRRKIAQPAPCAPSRLSK
jgi:hypothetical protein